MANLPTEWTWDRSGWRLDWPLHLENIGGVLGAMRVAVSRGEDLTYVIEELRKEMEGT